MIENFLQKNNCETTRNANVSKQVFSTSFFFLKTVERRKEIRNIVDMCGMKCGLKLMKKKKKEKSREKIVNDFSFTNNGYTISPRLSI